MAESMEYRPPTQSQNSNIFAVSIPNCATSDAFVETATKWLATALSSPPQAPKQPFAGRVGIRHRLQRGKRLRRDDEEGFRRVEIINRFS